MAPAAAWRHSEDAVAPARRMGHAGVTRVVVIRSGGTLVGLFFSAGGPRHPVRPGGCA